MSHGATPISELDSHSDMIDNPAEVDDLLRQINSSSDSSEMQPPQMQQYGNDYMMGRDEPSPEELAAAIEQAHSMPDNYRQTVPQRGRSPAVAAAAALKKQKRRQHYEDEDDYAPVTASAPRSAIKRASTRDFVVQQLHLPIIVALLIVAVFMSPLSEMIGTWIPTAAAAVYNGALTPNGVYVRASIVAILLLIYKYVIGRVFPSIPI